MNVKKTKTMVTSRKPENKSLDILVNDEILQQVLNFLYLGTEINQEARSEKEIERRCNIAKEKFSKIAHLLTSKKLKVSTKLRIVKCYVYLIFTYGCESWSLSKVLESKIEAMEMWCMRRLGNIKWKDKVTNEAVLKKLGTKRQLLSNIQKRKTKYFGHVKRKGNLLTTALEGKIEGKRPRGRPRNTWMSDIKEWIRQSAYACTTKAADRALSVSSLVNRRRGNDTPR